MRVARSCAGGRGMARKGARMTAPLDLADRPALPSDGMARLFNCPREKARPPA